MQSRVLAFLVVAFILTLIFYIGLTALAPEQLNAPTAGNGFKGPTGQPYVKGPTVPPPVR